MTKIDKGKFYSIISIILASIGAFFIFLDYMIAYTLSTMILRVITKYNHAVCLNKYYKVLSSVSILFLIAFIFAISSILVMFRGTYGYGIGGFLSIVAGILGIVAALMGNIVIEMLMKETRNQHGSAYDYYLPFFGFLFIGEILCLISGLIAEVAFLIRTKEK